MKNFTVITFLMALTISTLQGIGTPAMLIGDFPATPLFRQLQSMSPAELSQWRINPEEIKWPIFFSERHRAGQQAGRHLWISDAPDRYELILKDDTVIEAERDRHGTRIYALGPLQWLHSGATGQDYQEPSYVQLNNDNYQIIQKAYGNYNAAQEGRRMMIDLGLLDIPTTEKELIAAIKTDKVEAVANIMRDIVRRYGKGNGNTPDKIDVSTFRDEKGDNLLLLILKDATKYRNEVTARKDLSADAKIKRIDERNEVAERLFQLLIQQGGPVAQKMLLFRNNAGESVLPLTIGLYGRNNPIIKQLMALAYMEHVLTSPGEHLTPFKTVKRPAEEKNEAEEIATALRLQRLQLEEEQKAKAE